MAAKTPPRRTSPVQLPALLLTLCACSSPVENRDPVGEVFPTVEGESLAGEPVVLPDALAGEPAVLLVGYVQDTQFDIDRWLLGLVQAEAPLRVLEVPTVRGLVPSLLSERIDSGMRAGIPEEAWQDVVTVYDDARAIVELTGSERPRNARVLLLDAEGRVVWFHDRGYLPTLVLDLLATAEGLDAGPRADGGGPRAAGGE
jgi:hypothetical protein